MRALPIVMHYGDDFDSTESDFLRGQYDKLEDQGGK